MGGEDKIRQNLPARTISEPARCQTADGPGRIRLSVAINAIAFRSDGFIVTYDDIRAIPLPELKWDELNANMKMFYGGDRITDGNNEDLHERNAELRRILKWLWNAAVRPVLQDLGYLSSSARN